MPLCAYACVCVCLQALASPFAGPPLEMGSFFGSAGQGVSKAGVLNSMPELEDWLQKQVRAQMCVRVCMCMCVTLCVCACAA